MHGVLWWALVALHLSDQEQNTLFLSLAPMGVKERGFSAASRAMFGVPLSALSIEQAATLAAIFEVSDAIEPAFQTRVKMGQSSNVYAVAVMADGRVLFAQKDIKVTLGGCGG